MRGTKAITDYLSDRGYTAPQRLWARVIADTDGVLWLAGERPDRRGILTDATQQVVVVEWEDVARLLSYFGRLSKKFLSLLPSVSVASPSIF